MVDIYLKEKRDGYLPVTYFLIQQAFSSTESKLDIESTI